MASSFFGIEIAKTGLFMSQKHLNLTGHNISNANTVGYTRQRIVTQSIDPHGINVRWNLMEHGRVGGGVRLQTLERIRDQFIDRELRRESAKAGELGAKEDALLYIESIFDETNSSSLSNALTKFFNSLHELSKNTASQSLRTDVKTNATTFTETLHLYYDKLVQQQNSMNENMQQTVNRVNDIFKMVSDYNRQIYRYEITGENANDLRDKRDLLLDELSTLIDIQYEEKDGMLFVSTTSGTPLIEHVRYAELSVENDPANNNFHKVLITGVPAAPNDPADLAAVPGGTISTGPNAQMGQVATEINDLLAQIAAANVNIKTIEDGGGTATVERAARDLLVADLNTRINVTESEPLGGPHTLTITGSGETLLDHNLYSTISAVDDPANPGDLKAQITPFNYPPATTDFLYVSGELEGFRRIRDGNDANDYGIPYILGRLNALAQAMHDVINTQHNDGWTIPSGADPSQDGIDFFELDGTLPPAKGLNLSSDIIDDIWKIACSSKEILNPDDATQKGNNENMLEILKKIANEFDGAIDGTSFEGYLKSLVTEVGSQSSQVQTLNATQLSVVLNLESRRESVSGVSVDEEVTLMLQFQRMYQANSRMITALDEALDVLINRTGVVGR